MKERRLFRLFSALSRFTGFPDLREGQRIGAPRRSLRYRRNFRRAATHSSPMILGRLFWLQDRRSPRQPCALRRSMHIAENHPHAPGLRAWFYRWGIRAPSGRSVAIEIVRPPAQFLIVGSGRKPFSPHRRGTAAAIAAFKSHPSFSKANSLYAKTQKNIK